MELFTSENMRAIDRYAIEELKIPSTALMENAARALAGAAAELSANKRVVIFCGSGNNGGDGLAAARFLLYDGFEVHCLMVGSRDKMSPDASEMLRRLYEIGGSLEDFDPAALEAGGYLASAGLIIDAMIGTGLNSSVSGLFLDAINLINRQSAPLKLAADIPSGISADTGEVMGEAVFCDKTVTFAAYKRGQFLQPGNVYCGDIELADIGIPVSDEFKAQTKVYAVFQDSIKLQKRKSVSHKGDYGKLLIIAGSIGYTGAPVLAAKAAVRSGAGLVYLGVPESIYPIAAVKCDEAMPFPLPCDSSGRLSLSAAAKITEKLENCDACLLGPGLGISGDITELVAQILRASSKPVILDADGINALSANIDILDEAKGEIIITPHEGEFKRLGSLTGNRLESALAFAQKHGVVTVLKGHRTLSAMPDGRVYVNTTGNPGMAKGGSGDVLAGILAAFVCQMPLHEAAAAANYMHGKAGDLCAQTFGEYSMTPSDMIDFIHLAMN